MQEPSVSPSACKALSVPFLPALLGCGNLFCDLADLKPAQGDIMRVREEPLRGPTRTQPHLPALGIQDAVPRYIHELSLQQDAISPEHKKGGRNAGCQSSRKPPSVLTAWVRISAETETSLTPVSPLPVSEKAWNRAATLCFYHQNLHCFKEPSQAMPRPRDASPPPQTHQELL